MTVEVQEGTLAALLPQLARGEIDLVVGRLTSDFDSEGLRFEACYAESMGVVAGREHPLAGKAGLKLADLADQGWILPTPETAYRARLDAAFRREGVESPRELVESVSILTNTMLLQETTMVGALPYNVARHYVAAGSVAVLDVGLPPPSGPVGLITREGPLSNPTLGPLLDAVREVGARMAR